jgi:hypothetical protein
MRCEVDCSLPTIFHDLDQLICIFYNVIEPHESLLQLVLLLYSELFEFGVVFTAEAEHVLALFSNHHPLREEGLSDLGAGFNECLEIRMEFFCCHLFRGWGLYFIFFQA